MNTIRHKKIGLGSFFHEVNPETLINYNIIDKIPKYELFYTGRHAIKHLIELIDKQQKISTIWLPNYYCQHVTNWLKTNFKNISFYSIDPFFEEKSFNIIDFAKKDDVVILNNFWGIFKYNIPTTKEKPICIEDHSHGWLSDSCLNSQADYCFASLRKTLPIPLGGIAWSPKQNEISKNNSIIDKDPFYQIWNIIDNAMKLKADFITNSSTDKNKYLSLISKTEEALHNQHDVLKLKNEHKEYITTFLNKDYNFYKSKNLKYILEKIKPNKHFKLICNESNSSFGLHIIFKDRKKFEDFKLHLIKNIIYPSELWPDNILNTEFKYMMNIHIDFRYDFKDMSHIANQINFWTINKK
tara:strand:- start:10295 stop:11359 length:1065 start_codon:yes stop_codon:yes gene_type:complete